MELVSLPECPWCGSLDLVPPASASSSEEYWWCEGCTDYIPDPAGEKEKFKKVGAILAEEAARRKALNDLAAYDQELKL